MAKETPNEDTSKIQETNTNNFGHSKSTNQTPSHSSMDIDQDTDTDDQTSTVTTATLPTTTHKYWRIAAMESHHPHRFLQYIDNIKLNGDTISHLHQFYERICLAFHSSFSKPTDILPPFRNISPQYSFFHLLVPKNEYYLGFHAILNTYNWYGSALYAGLTDSNTISPRVAPLAHRAIQIDKTETDGWQLLYLLLSTRNPLLGGRGDNVTMEITNLRVCHDEDIHKFYERVMTLQEKLEFSTETISKTKLLEKYLHAMTKSTEHHYLLQHFLVDLNLHIAREGHNITHPTMTVHTIYRHLVATNAPTTFTIKSTKKYKPNISQLSTAKLNVDNQEQSIQNNEVSPTNQSHDNDNNNNSTFILHDIDDEQYYLKYDPTIQAFRCHSNQRSKIICEACGLAGYPASKCFRRGFSFLPRDVQRRISAYNTKYGDTPTEDKSPQESNKQILPAPTTKIPDTTDNKTINIHQYEANQAATIRKLQHVLPTDNNDVTDTVDTDIEFIEMYED